MSDGVHVTMPDDLYVAWLAHMSEQTGHSDAELFWPELEWDGKVPHPIGWRCRTCGQSVGQVPR
jgi:hypothetical protein